MDSFDSFISSIRQRIQHTSSNGTQPAMRVSLVLSFMAITVGGWFMFRWLHVPDESPLPFDSSTWKAAALPVAIVFCLLVALAPVTYADVPEPRPTESARSKLAAQYSGQAIGQRMKGHFPEALRLISKSIEMYPKDCQFLFIRSGIYGNQKRYREAISDLNLALRDRQPNCPVSTLLQSRAYYFLKIGKFAKCAKDLSAANKLTPNNSAIHLLQARLYRSQHRWAAAQAEYRETLKLLRQEGGCRPPPPPVAAADFIVVDVESLVNKELTEVERLSRRMKK